MKQLSYITILFLLQLIGLNKLNAQNTIPLDGITSIEVSGVIPVILIQDNKEYMDLSLINDEWREVLKYSIKGNILKINSNKKGTAIQKKTPLTIHIKELSKIVSEKIAVISNEGVLKAEALNIKLEGVSSITLNMEVSQLNLQNTGASSVTLTGKAKNANFDLEGVSQSNCKKLSIDSLNLESTGASSGKIKVTNIVRGEIGGVSAIEIIGNPKEEINYSGIHSLRRNNLNKSDSDTLIVPLSKLQIPSGSSWPSSSSTTIKLGNKNIVILGDSSYKIKGCKDTINRWSGIDIGLNGLMNSNGSTDLSNPSGTLPIDRTDFMEIDLIHSWMLRLNFLEANLRTHDNRFGILTGLGIEWNSYELKNDVRLTSRGRGLVDPNPNQLNQNYTYGTLDTTVEFSKNRFKTFKINVPAFIEVNLGKEKNFYLVGGAILGLNLKSKMKYKSNNGKEKVKENFNVNPFSASLHAKVGYKGTALFATYGLTSLFEKNYGPEVYPFSLGLSFSM